MLTTRWQSCLRRRRLQPRLRRKSNASSTWMCNPLPALPTLMQESMFLELRYSLWNTLTTLQVQLHRHLRSVRLPWQTCPSLLPR